MRFHLPSSLLLALVIAGTPSVAKADNPSAGSLLIFPEFDNRGGNQTLFTVTNTNTDTNFNPGTNLPNGTVKVHFVYIGRFDANGNPIPCLETDMQVTLTPGDTFSFLTSAHNPQQQQGFMFAYAKHPTQGYPLRFDHLIGNALFVNGLLAIDYSTNAISLKGGTLAGNNLSGDGDSNRDLDGVEYERLPDWILIPRFVGTTPALKSELILIGLSGGANFTTIANFVVFNDNEEPFSSQRQFQCWERIRLDQISGVFSDAFLKSTNHALNEPLGGGFGGRETGWFLVDGSTASSTNEQITDPAVYAILIEKIGRSTGASDLPFGKGYQSNGDLWPIGNLGDGGLGDNQ